MGRDVFKGQRLTDRITQEVSEFLRHDLSDIRAKKITITRAELSLDGKVASLFWDSFDVEFKAGEGKKFMRKLTPLARRCLASRLGLREVPEIHFVMDEQFEAEAHITSLLNDEKRQGRFY